MAVVQLRMAFFPYSSVHCPAAKRAKIGKTVINDNTNKLSKDCLFEIVYEFETQVYMHSGVIILYIKENCQIQTHGFFEVSCTILMSKFLFILAKS